MSFFFLRACCGTGSGSQLIERRLKALLLLVDVARKAARERKRGVVVAAALRRNGEYLSDGLDALLDFRNVPSRGAIGFLDQVRGGEALDQAGDVLKPELEDPLLAPEINQKVVD